MILVLLGAPGSGKGTLAEFLVNELEFFHLSSGDLLRKEVEAHSEKGQEISTFLGKGRLVPDPLIIELISEKILKLPQEQNLILDGFPRRQSQAEALEQMLSKHHLNVDQVIDIHVKDDEIIKRLAGRLICKECRAVYNQLTRPSQKAGICDACGGALMQRKDDQELVIKERLFQYREDTLPLSAYYQEKGIYHKVNGERAPGEVFKEVSQILFQNNA